MRIESLVTWELRSGGASSEPAGIAKSELHKCVAMQMRKFEGRCIEGGQQREP